MRYLSKYVVLILLLWQVVLIDTPAYGQLCEDFNNDNTTNLTGGSGRAQGIGNWWFNCASMAIANDANCTSDGSNYFQLQDDYCTNNLSIVWNSVDFSGDWLQYDGCFCYDFNFISSQVGGVTPSVLFIFDGPDPYSSTRIAQFKLANSLNPGGGWVTICAPLKLASADGSLPGNLEGAWQMLNGGTAADWDALIRAVNGIYFKTDINSGREVFGLDNFCLSACPPSPFDCCKTPLQISVTQASQISSQSQAGKNYSTYSNSFVIQNDPLIPITELRVVTTDIYVAESPQDCEKCKNDPATWMSIESPTSEIGDSPGLLKGGDIYSGYYRQPFIPLGSGNTREMIWTNSNGTSLKSGDNFEVSYTLPPFVDNPCCSRTIEICQEVSWKDANCQYCDTIICTSIAPQLEDLSIVHIQSGCCEVELEVDNDLPASYLWSTGERSKQITVGSNGTYTVDVVLMGQSHTLSFNVSSIMKGPFSTLSYAPQARPDNGLNFVIRDYFKGINDPFAYNATNYTLWIFNSNDTDPYQGAFRKIEGEADCATGFLNGDIQWDGRDDYGNKIQSGMYNFVLRLENCDRKCASESSLCNETHEYDRYHYGHSGDCASITREPLFPPVPWPTHWKCNDGWAISTNRIGVIDLQW